jgi:hypothetical protein
LNGVDELLAPWSFSGPIGEYVQRLESARIAFKLELEEILWKIRRARKQHKQGETAGTVAGEPAELSGPASGAAQDLYIDLMKKCLLNLIYCDAGRVPKTDDQTSDRAARMEGKDWPEQAHTMIGWKRLSHIQLCIEDVLRSGIPGDLMETGVWRGGATIFMRAVLRAWDVTDRCVWVADSFAGLPRPRADVYPADEGYEMHQYDELAISLEEVRSNFVKYGLLDDQVKFLKGWFRDTLPSAPVERLSVLRLDGDMYESTIDALNHLYPKLSVGGYLIVDDYGAFPSCRQAIEDYRQEHGISEPIQHIDWTGVFWQRETG